MTGAGFWQGAGLLLASGAVNGSFALPMRWTRNWRWENTWLVFSAVALLILPAGFALAFVPNLGRLYAELTVADLAPALGFGFLWGLGQATFGIAIARVGMAMAFALVVGSGNALGSIVPLAVLHPSALLSSRGGVLVLGALLLGAGLAVYGHAARRRELESTAAPAARPTGGLAICLISGVLGAMINFGFAFSVGIEARAVELGVPRHNATFAIWLPVLAAGSIPNLLYSLYLLRKNRSAGLFRQAPLRGCALAALMGVLWLVSTLGYGWGAATIGLYGASLGYAMYDSSLILWSTMLGVMAGEWRNVRPQVARAMWYGVALIVAAVAILSVSSTFG